MLQSSRQPEISNSSHRRLPLVNIEEGLVRCLLIESNLFICEANEEHTEAFGHKIAFVINIDMLKFKIHYPSNQA